MAIVTAYVGYVAALNAFLSTSLFGDIVNQDPETIDIHFRRGWTLFPGTIHARDLSIRSSDSNVEWILRLDEVEFDVSFLSLAKQTFDVTRARGHGISMRVRQKLSIPPQTNEDIAYLPPIEGYPAYSMRPAAPPSLERWFDEHYALWTVSLSDVIADDVREVWIDSGRFEGSARITGGFYLKPIRDVAVGPAHVDAREGSRVTLGKTTALLPAIAGSIDLRIDHFDPRAVQEGPDGDIFRYLTLQTNLSAKIADPSTLPLSLPLYVAGEMDVPRLRLAVDRGVLTPGTVFELASPRTSVAKADVIGRASTNVFVEVERDERGPFLRGRAQLDGISVVAADGTGIVDASRLLLSTETRALDLSKNPFGDARLAIDLPEAEMRDARVLEQYLHTASLRIAAGRATANAHAELFAEDHRATGRFELHATEADVRLTDMRVRGSVTARGSMGAYRFGENAADDVRVALDFSKAAADIGHEKHRFDATNLHVAGTSKRLHFDAPLHDLEVDVATPDLNVDSSDLLVSTRANGRVRVRDWDGRTLVLDGATLTLDKTSLARSGPTRPFASIERSSASLRGSRIAPSKPFEHLDLELDVTGGKVTDPAGIDAFLPKEAGIGMATDGGSFDARARIAVDGQVARGRITASAKGMGIRGERLFVYGDADLGVDVRRFALETKTLDLGPSHLVVTAARGRIEGPVPSNLTARRIELRGQASGLDLEDPNLTGVDARLVLDEVLLPDARALQFLVPSKNGLRIAKGSARAFGDVAVNSSTAVAGGTLEVDIVRGALGIHETELEGDFAFRALFRGFDPKTSTLDFSGSSLTMSDVRVSGASAETRHWRGEAVLEKATLRLHGPESETPRLDGVLHLDADDARPLLGLVLRDSLPKVFVGLVTMPRLTGYARLHVSPNLVLADGVSASGGDVALRGSYGIYGAESQGAFIVEKGPLSVGIDLDKDGASPHFFNLDAWLGKHEHAARAKAAEELRRASSKPADRDGERQGGGRGDKVR